MFEFRFIRKREEFYAAALSRGRACGGEFFFSTEDTDFSEGKERVTFRYP